MKTYNGFSSSKRAKVGHIQLAAIKAGEFPAPKQCELCLSTEGQMQLHNEDYSKPFDDAHPICRSCHLALHVRFTKPERWEARKEYIRSVRGEGDYWWNLLINTPVNINPLHNANSADGNDLMPLAVTPLWLARLVLSGASTPESLQSAITTFVEQTHLTVTGCYVPAANELLVLHWPDTREGYVSQTLEQCGQAATELAKMLQATYEPVVLNDGEVLCMMGLKVGGYDNGRIAMIQEITDIKGGLTTTPAHMVSARARHDGTTESYGEPTVLLQGVASDEAAIHVIGDQLQQYHYAIHYGGKNTKFYETKWAGNGE